RHRPKRQPPVLVLPPQRPHFLVLIVFLFVFLSLRLLRPLLLFPIFHATTTALPQGLTSWARRDDGLGIREVGLAAGAVVLEDGKEARHAVPLPRNNKRLLLAVVACGRSSSSSSSDSSSSR